MRHCIITASVIALCGTCAAFAEKYYLVVGADAQHYPAASRAVFGSGGVPGTFYDGDRLAGTTDVGPVVTYQGATGTIPMYPPNHLGSLSMLFRRGTIPAAGGIPFMGIEFLGGPLLDLDGELNNGARSLVPVPPATPVEIPDTDSFIALDANLGAGTIALVDFDVTGCNEGAPNMGPDLATILVTIAGTQPDGAKTGAINPTIDTRLGTLTPFAGGGGTLTGVYAVGNLGYEWWEDAIDPFVGSPEVLGSMQFLGALHGWLVVRNPSTGQFPTLAGQGLGSTHWPAVDAVHAGQTYNTANGLAGGTALVHSGAGGDIYTAANNGGLALTDLGGDLGAYLDTQVVPRLPATANRFVYLESAGFGINNSSDPVFTDTIGYDAVIVAANDASDSYAVGDLNCDGTYGYLSFGDINPFVQYLSDFAGWQAAYPGCPPQNGDINGDGTYGYLSFGDINPFVALLSGNP